LKKSGLQLKISKAALDLSNLLDTNNIPFIEPKPYQFTDLT
jgi:hypothetical protein